MAIRTQQVSVDELQIGMYISGIDRPWGETPFPLQGFHLEDREQLEQLKYLCKWVNVDSRKSRISLNLTRDTDPILNSATFESGQAKRAREILNLRLRAMQNDRPYQNISNLSSEMRYARKVHRRISENISRTLQALAGEGRLRFDTLKTISNDLVSSVIRNPDAFAYLSRIESHSEDVLNYSIRLASWAILTGRHLDLTRDTLCDLALASLLCKIGYTTIPQEILRAKGTPTPHVNEMLKWSLVRGVKLLRSKNAFNGRVVKLVSHHLERYDGSGFPRGVSGRHIPLLSQLIGIADYYENLVSYDFRDRPLSSTDAVRELYKKRNTLFDAHLVEEFIQAIGLYPTGSVVQLNESRLAIVIGQNQARLKPKLLILEDDRKPWEIFRRRVVDLSSANCEDFIVTSVPSLPSDNEHRHRRYFKQATTL